ncbi:hydrolase [Streptomyces badius]
MNTSRRNPRRSRLRTAAASAAAVALAATGLAALPAWASAAADGIVVQYRTSASGASADQSEPWLKVRNAGSTSVPLSGVKLRYYFKADSASAAYRFACSWAVKGCANITGTFGTLANPTATADRYLEIGFTAGRDRSHRARTPGTCSSGSTEDSWASLVQSDDYSFGPDRTTYGDWSKVTAQVNGSLVWGQAPAGNGPTDPPDPTDPPTDPPGDGARLFDDFNYSSTPTRRSARTAGPCGPGRQPGGAGRDLGGQERHLRLAERELGDEPGGLDGRYGRFDQAHRDPDEVDEVQERDVRVPGEVQRRTAHSGPDGDRIVQTFFTINDLKAPMADDYAEYDFEYLPNGG